MGMACTHNKITRVMTLNECEVHAGSEMQVREHGHEFDLVISLTGHANRKPVNFRMSRGSLRMLSNLNDYMKRKMHNLIIDWPDMSIPDLDLEFWQALYQDLAKMKGRAVVHCMGGHGRTGTALAILAFLSSSCGDEDAVSWVREVYCQESVETASQITYLRNVIGIPTHAEPSSSYKYGSGRSWLGSDDQDEKPERKISSGPSKYFGGKTTGYLIKKGGGHPSPKDQAEEASKGFPGIGADYEEIP